MASFSVDITEVVFAAGNTGYKDITISNMPSGGVNCSITSGSRYFGYRIPGDDTNVYRVYTTGTNSGVSPVVRNGVFKITNADDSSDYFEISLYQLKYGYWDLAGQSRGYVIDVICDSPTFINVPRDYHYTGGSANAFTQVFADKDNGGDYTAHFTVLLDAGWSIPSSSVPSWISITSETTYTDTGFKQVYISLVNNYDGPRQAELAFGASGTSASDEVKVYQDGYSSTTSGCTTSLSFPSSGGTLTATVKHPSISSSSYPMSESGALYKTYGKEYDVTRDSKSTNSSVFSITVPANTTGSAIRTFVWFYDYSGSSSKYLGKTIITQPAGSGGSLSVVPSSLSFTANGGTENISLTYGGDHYNVDATEVYTWTNISLSDVSTGMAAGTVTVPVNTSTTSRSGSVYFSDELGASIALPISQDGLSAQLSANPSTLSFTSAGGSQTTAVTYAGTLSAASLPSWCSSSYVDVDASHRTYTVTAASNTSTSSRTFNWRLDDSYNHCWIYLDQAAAEVVSLVISPTSSSVSGSSGSVQITVRSTGISSVSYNISDSWITYGSKSGSVYTFNYAVNGTSSSRTGTITFSGGGLTRTFTLSQDAGYSISISPSSVTVGSGANTYRDSDLYTVSYTSPDVVPVLTYSVVSGDSWLSMSTSSTSPSYTQVTVTANTSTTSRTGIIRWTLYDSNSHQVDYADVTVVQQGVTPTPVMTISPSSLTFDNTGGSNNVTVTYTGDLSYNSSSFPSWLSITEVSSSSGQKVFRLTATATSLTTVRTFNVVFQDSGSIATLVVNQQGRSASFSVTPQSLSLIKEGGSTGLTFFNVPSGGLSWNITYGSGSGWITVSFMSGTVANVQVTANSGSRRNAVIKFYNQDDPDDYLEVPVVQNGEGFECIWMDKAYSPSSFEEGESYHYRLQNADTSDVLFEGISVPLSDSDYPLGINVPRLVDSYISSNSIDDLKEDMVLRKLDGNISVNFIDINDLSNPTLVKTFNYWNDWSGPGYNTTYDTSMVLSDPINHKGCTGMVIPFSVYDDESASYSVVETKRNGSQVNYSLGVPSDSFVYAAGEFYESKKVSFKKGDTELFSYDMDNCGNGYVIYRNRFGGWDSFLIEGNIYKYDDYNRLSAVYPKYPNNYGYNREKRTDRINIKTKYEVNTGWLTDEEAQRLVFHLLSSPTIGFHSFEDRSSGTFPDYLISVSVVNTSVEYKKFKNGKKLVNYTITFEENDTNQVQR